MFAPDLGMTSQDHGRALRTARAAADRADGRAWHRRQRKNPSHQRL